MRKELERFRNIGLIILLAVSLLGCVPNAEAQVSSKMELGVGSQMAQKYVEAVEEGGGNVLLLQFVSDLENPLADVVITGYGEYKNSPWWQLACETNAGDGYLRLLFDAATVPDLNVAVDLQVRNGKCVPRKAAVPDILNTFTVGLNSQMVNCQQLSEAIYNSGDGNGTDQDKKNTGFDVRAEFLYLCGLVNQGIQAAMVR